MLLGIIANITKENVFEVVSSFTSKLKKEKVKYLLTNSIREEKGKFKLKIDHFPPPSVVFNTFPYVPAT